MLTKNFTISCPVGLHARPVSALVSIAKGFKSNVTIKFKEKAVPAESILGVMTLGVKTGESVEITAAGEDEDKAMQRLEEFFEKELQNL